MYIFRLQTVVLMLLVSFIQLDISGQGNIDSLDFNQKVYWFLVKGKIGIDPSTKKERFFLRSKRKQIRSGTLLDFEKGLFRGLIRGKHLFIGPFSDKEDANIALPFYNLSKLTEKMMETKISNHQDHSGNLKYYWFFLDLKPKRGHVPILERSPVNLNYGSLKDFRTILWEGTFFYHVTIGPFTSEKDAKISRRLYRLEED